MRRIHSGRNRFLIGIAVIPILLGGAGSALLGACGPFTDVAADTFCPLVLEIFTLGITTGTTPTTYDPASNVSRLQMAAFLSRGVDGVLSRGSRRAAMKQFWKKTQGVTNFSLTTVGDNPKDVAADGLDLWVTNGPTDAVSRVRGSDGRLLETWTGATGADAVLSAAGKVFVTGFLSPGRLYRINPAQSPGAVTTVASTLGANPIAIAFDGSLIWTANFSISAGVSIVTPGATIPWTVTTVTSGFTGLTGIAYDGSNMWVTDGSVGLVFKLNSTGGILQTVTVASAPNALVFDGANLWIPGLPDTLSVVRVSTGALLATLTGNGLSSPYAAAFDGQRILVTNQSGNSVSLWKAADLTTIGTVPMAGTPTGVCSDGVNFWVTLLNGAAIARF